MTLSLYKIPFKLSYINIPLIYLIFKDYGFKIVPETTIPSLALLTLSQLTYNKSIQRKEHFLFFLWLGTFSVFSSSLYYLTYAILSLIIFYILEQTKINSSFKEVLKELRTNFYQILLIFTATLVLFIFFPRFYNFLPSANNQSIGKIGYSESINNSSISKLELSSLTAFYAETRAQIPVSQLYWRGRVHTYTDGYNWKSKTLPPLKGSVFSQKYTDLIETKIKYEQDLSGDLIVLDTPYKVFNSNLRSYHTRSTNEFKLYQKNKKAIYNTQSFMRYKSNDKVELPRNLLSVYTQLPAFIPNSVKNVANSLNFRDAKEIILGMKKFFIKEKFSYTLEPGPLPTMNHFLEKKQGYCTHYASLLAVILRYKQIPARVVSGFQGGEYNDVGEYYTVKSNDAHAWVEYFSQGQWQRVDPTEFISPARIIFGGSQFLTAGNQIQSKNQNTFLNTLKKMNLFLDNLNYQVSLLLDNFDRNSQKDLAESFNLKYKHFFIIGFIFLLLITGLTYYFMSKVKYSKYEIYLRKLDKKYKTKEKKFFDIKTIGEAFDIIKNLDLTNQQQEALEAEIHKYQIARYSKDANISKATLSIK